MLGYETATTSNITCVKPEFRPQKGWAADYTLLRLQDARNVTIKYDDGALHETTGTPRQIPILLTGHTYTIPAPMLEPKESQFVGYQQPHTKIHYELDFSQGAVSNGKTVELGCNTTVVGDAGKDGRISKSIVAHPNAMHLFSYQWPSGRGTVNATPPDPGFYPQKCPRYHRFSVISAGNFTFVSDPWPQLRRAGVGMSLKLTKHCR